MKKVITILITFILAVSGVWGQSNTEILLSIKNFIDNNSKTLSNTVWKPPVNNKLWDDLTITQELKNSYVSYNFYGYNRNKNNGTWDGLLLRYDPTEQNKYISIKDAKQIYNEILNVFGKPDKIVDYGFLAESQYRQDFICQWDMKDYSLQFQTIDYGCIFDKPGIIAIILEVKKIGSLDNIVPLVGIRIKAITGRFRLRSNNSWYPLTSADVTNYTKMDFILDYNNKKVLIPNYKVRGDLVDISDSQSTLLFYDNKKNLTMKIVLNRFTGSTITTLYDNGNEDVIVNGIAEKLDLNFGPRF